MVQGQETGPVGNRSRQSGREGSKGCGRTDLTVTGTIPFAVRKRGRRKLKETGNFLTIKEITDADYTYSSYVSRALHMTRLAPEIMQPRFEGRQPGCLTKARATQPFPAEWPYQKFDGWENISRRQVTCQTT